MGWDVDVDIGGPLSTQLWDFGFDSQYLDSVSLSLCSFHCYSLRWLSKVLLCLTLTFPSVTISLTGYTSLYLTSGLPRSISLTLVNAALRLTTERGMSGNMYF